MIISGYEWVFNNPETFVVDKLDGSNVKVLTYGGRLYIIKIGMADFGYMGEFTFCYTEISASLSRSNI